jgi:hypothetical protein
MIGFSVFVSTREWNSYVLEYSARVMFSLRILFWSVVRFSPRRSDAPPLPDILPDAAFNASTITCRSACSNVDDADPTLRLAVLFSWS